MELSDRKKKILHVVVDDYIADVEPISSKKVQQRHLQELSSATIRSELAALEEMGYLGQPHTSAGRVPLKKAYRFYVDKLMERGQPDKKQIEYIREHFGSSIKNAEELVHGAAKVITDMTNYTAIGAKSTVKQEIIDNIKLVRLSKKTVLVIIVAGDMVLRDSIIAADEELDDVYIDTGAEVLQKVFCGKTVEHAVKMDTQKLISSEFSAYRALFQNIIDTLSAHVSSGQQDIVVEGAQKTLSYPEFSDIEKARKFLAILDQKSKLISLVKGGEPKTVDLSITIGGEDGTQLEDFSVVTARYSIEGRELGTAGVLGPMRMEYSKVVSVLECIRNTLNSLIK